MLCCSPAWSMQRWLDKRNKDVVVWDRLSPDHHHQQHRKCMSMRSQGHVVTQGFTTTGFSRTSLEVFFFFTACAPTAHWQWALDCWCIILWYYGTISLFTAWRGLIKIPCCIGFFFNQYKPCDAHYWPFLCKQTPSVMQSGIELIL